MGVLLLRCAACIILPIIKGEGIVAVFFPYLIRRPLVQTAHFPLYRIGLWLLLRASVGVQTFIHIKSANLLEDPMHAKAYSLVYSFNWADDVCVVEQLVKASTMKHAFSSKELSGALSRTQRSMEK